MTSTTVPLNKLLLSPRNVRKTNGEEDIESLADSIQSKGLLQNLVVSASPTGKGFFEVDAGGRRWRALQRLAERKALVRNWPVPVIVIPRDDAAEASLAENLQKIAMNPADEVVAFAAIIERYADNGVVDRAAQVANLARRFGRDVRYVEQRLRLAALAPEILQALRDGTITLDAAKAYAAVADQALQLKVFAGQQKVGGDQHRVAAIRAAYAGKVYRKADRIVRFITLDAYLEAGGRVDLDLFMGSEDEEVLLDTALVDRLAKEKADEEAGELAQAAGFRAGAYSPLTSQYWQHPKPPVGFGTLVYGHGGHTTPLAPEVKETYVAIAKLRDDGSSLELTDWHFRPAVPAGAKLATAGGPETEIDRLARIRRETIEARAIRMATPPLAGTPLEGRAYWPEHRWVDSVQRLADGDYVVAILVKVPAADVDRLRAEAERALDAEEAGKTIAGPDDEDEFDRPLEGIDEREHEDEQADVARELEQVPA